MKRIIFFMICFFLVHTVKSQLMPELLYFENTEKQIKGFKPGKIDITTLLDKSLKDYFKITDTLDSSHNQWDVLQVEGFDFQFTLRIHRDSAIVKVGGKPVLMQESHIPPYPLWTYDISTLADDELAIISLKLREMAYDTIVLRQAFQTCISYAFESIFLSHGIDPEPFFFRRSVPAEADDVEKILENLFIKVETLDNIRRRTLNRSKYLYDDQVFILFRDLRGEPMHACFNLKGRTWTKNGIRPFTSHLTPLPVIDNYNRKKNIKSDTPEHLKEFFTLGSVHSIEIYQLNFGAFD